METMAFRRVLAGGLALVGGALMLASGYSSRGFLYTALGYAEPRISDLLVGVYASAAVLSITLVEGVIALGGLTVMIGGLAIVLRFVTVGRILVWLGGGAGFLGLIIGFGYSAYRLGGFGPVLGYLPYWIGLAMAITGRTLAKGA
ncbi:MAG: hypothetical protein JRN71_05135 [Nitrososphaerota archaeon]|jgi:hypothetical protein|nr:hypothetical protein [Nitrososphaerota archaeon]